MDSSGVSKAVLLKIVGGVARDAMRVKAAFQAISSDPLLRTVFKRGDHPFDMKVVGTDC